MIEDVFLTYVNSSLKEIPKNIINMMEVAREYFSFVNPILTTDDEFFYIIDLIAELAQFGNPEVAHKKFNGLQSNKTYDVKEKWYHNPEEWWLHESDFDAQKVIAKWQIDKNDNHSYMWCREVSFAYLYGYVPVKETFLRGCESCKPFGIRLSPSKLLESSLFVPGGHIDCCQCNHLIAKQLVSEIVGQKEYSETDFFGYTKIGRPSSPGRYKVEYQEIFIGPNDKPSPFKEKLFSNIEYIPGEGIYGSCYYPADEHYDIYVDTIIDFLFSESLVGFLLTNDRRKLKYCQECNKFYISKGVRPAKFCSDKCRLKHHNRKRIESGEAREYKRKKRMEGAKESYYG